MKFKKYRELLRKSLEINIMFEVLLLFLNIINIMIKNYIN